MTDRVLILESPGLIDIDTGDREGEHLDKLLRMLRIESTYRPFSGHSRLELLLVNEAPNAACLHLCGHGDSQQFAFTNGRGLAWSELARGVITYAPRKIVILAACHSDELRIVFRTLAEALEAALPGSLVMPRCVLTFFGTVYFADSLLAWGLFYRHLFDALRSKNLNIANCPPRVILDALSKVKASGLNVKICAAYWYDKYRCYANISPWGQFGRPVDAQVVAIETGTPTDPMW